MLKRNKKGFTIVELVIVIGVIAILSAILIPTFVNLTKNAENARTRSDLASAYSMYAADAADGVKDGTEDDPSPVVLELYAQEDIALKKEGATEEKYYTYNAEKGWATELAALPSGKTAQDLSLVYGGYAFYLIQ